ncbi:hypothetical protein OEIGOIKO_05832 [Streptomyces chrestomyceticus JCM 4735]|uniref:DUF4031 domain-containing protein n=1 Tax=Streptomyces chrestomyceticus JCM 4735 TaxID=1306181 RepID=A0A7U9KZ03_9ACTN|nr:DUF4031 domain-containing protein [Streptomyces chrestomyceticus]GCD38022.1 hypothetical protein OEIGOIKO_05832 [Streptomyces chrestomyceticus JCM 4735]
MSVYVDEIKDYTTVSKMRGLRYTHWCHLLADDIEELHAFAQRLGLRMTWFQDHAYRWHYDLTAGKRAMAVRYGAQEVDHHFVAELLAKRREAIGLPAVETPGGDRG